MAHLNLPVVVVTCIRDLPMLALQAESMNIYYNSWVPDTIARTKLYIIVNEPDNLLPHWNAHFESYRATYVNIVI